MLAGDDLARAIVKAAYLEGDFTLSSGQKSRYYLDKFRFSTDPALLAPIADGLASLLPPGLDRLAGVELGAVPLVTAVALRTGLPFVIVRKSAKEYGTSKLIEGVLEPGARVALIEDVLTTAGQAIRAAQMLSELGARVEKVVYVVDREQGADANIRAAGFDPAALFTKTSLGI
ncbi:MAG TPA: orotate phosphoribosyltransferase [Deinococcales bacterium]|nr:orotate phosphoribosyltransferase [Deinococcales bacterium]